MLARASKEGARVDRAVVAAYVVMSVLVVAVANFAFHTMQVDDVEHRWPDHAVISVLSRWDTGWYFHIAEDGYFYAGPGLQSAVGFFPAYPALMRVFAVVVQDTIVAGVIVSLVAGATAFALLRRWTALKVDDRAAWWTLGVVAIFPFAYYLFGVTYSESLFLAACVGSFYLLERDRPVAAGLVGALATATRPTGVALVIGLAIRTVERRGGLRSLRPRDVFVLLSAGGIALFCAYLWWRFDDPLAYTRVKGANGWNQDVTARSLLKRDFFRHWDVAPWSATTIALTLHALASVIAVATLPAVVKRFGWGYAAYCVVVIAIPLVASTDFLAMGRYILPAFPVFAVIASRLARTPRLGYATLAVSGSAFIWLLMLFARWRLIS